MSNLEAKLALLSCPGDTIIDTLEAIGMSQTELAERLGRTPKYLTDLVKGKAHITSEVAQGLERVLGVPAEGWLNLERKYQDEQMKIKALRFGQECIAWVEKFPLPFLKKKGIIPNTRKKEEMVEPLLSFFRVASPREHSQIYNQKSGAFKIELRHTTESEAISVWLRLGELDADSISLSAFDKKKLKSSIPDMQDISFRMDSIWMNELHDVCASCGVALSYTPCISKAPIYGAARWIKNNSVPLIQVTDRGKDMNKFWFSFYHELGHIILHGKKDIFIDGLTEDELKQDEEKETEADVFAAKTLLNGNYRRKLESMLKSQVTTSYIKKLSQKWHVHPSILVSQLQRLEKIGYSDRAFISLKHKVEF